MQALVPTDYSAKITWLGRTADRKDGLESHSCDTLELRFAGAEGEARSGLTRPACPRVKDVYETGTEIRNVRQLSAMSAEELADIAQDLDLTALDPAWIGLSLVVEGLPDFSHVPPGARLQAASGATLVVDMLNLPCNFAGRSVEKAAPGHGIGFKQAASGKRGVTLWVEREGRISVGDPVRLFVPGQRGWKG
jgi:MOSC domain-containing protein YiiM